MTVVDLGAVAAGSGGAVWSLPHGGDLDANLVRLDPDGSIEEHVNGEVDVLIFVQSGTGSITIDGATHEVGTNHLALVPRGSTRGVAAGPTGISYLSVHRRRRPISITSRSDAPEGR